MEKELEYKVRYGVLPSKVIFNLLGPGIKGSKDIIDQEKIKIKEQKYVERRNKIDNFYSNLEKSILEQGIRNPLSVVAGKIRTESDFNKLPIEMKSNPNTILVVDFQGGSRLYIAQKYNLKVPCIISDFVNRFKRFPELKTDEEVLSYFADKPDKIRYYPWGVYFHNLPHIHMEAK